MSSLRALVNGVFYFRVATDADNGESNFAAGTHPSQAGEKCKCGIAELANAGSANAV